MKNLGEDLRIFSAICFLATWKLAVIILYLWIYLAVYSDLKKENAALKVENAELKHNNEQLKERVKELSAVSIEDLPSEEWRNIEGYEGLYQVSNFGRVKNFSNGRMLRNYTPAGSNYVGVVLSRSNKMKHFLVHRLVAQAFIPNPDNKLFVNHINGIKNDNRVENLEWVTQKENVRHAWENGLCDAYICAKRKLSDEDVIYIRTNPDGLSKNKLALKFDVSPRCISFVESLVTYKDVK